jgi:hypothetical protein
VSLAATISGAERVLATDYNLFSLALLEKAKTLQSVPLPVGVLTTQFFDVKDFSIPLPGADVVVIADLLYDKSLAVAVAKRVAEAYFRGSLVIVGNSPGRCGTNDFLSACRGHLGFEVETLFQNIIGQTCIGHRNNLIRSSTSNGRPVDISLLELQLIKQDNKSFYENLF